MSNQLILGAGASGLSLGILLPNSRLIEASTKVGGLSTTIQLNGFTFDQGPHIMFSKDKEILQIMVDSLSGNVHTSKRNNVVMLNGNLMRYPIENDLGSLPEDLKVEAVRDFLAVKITPSTKEPSNLEEWFRYSFGDALTEMYFKPYNEKVWNLPFKDLSMTWADRIPSPPWQDVLKGALGIKTEGYLHQLYYQYPEVGGYEALMTAWKKQIPLERIRTSSKVESIKRKAKGTFELCINGKFERFEGNIFSTLPLNVMVEAYQDLPPKIVELIKSLPVNPLITVNLGFKKRDDHQYTAVYIPDEDYLVNRISYPGVFSPKNVPSDDYMLIQAEITVKSGDDVMNWSDAALIEHVLMGLRKRNLVLEDDEPMFRYVDRIKNAYVVYPKHFETARNEIIQYFESQDVFLNGRFGSHSYLNVDGILLQSIALARRFDDSLELNKIRKLFGLRPDKPR